MGCMGCMGPPGPTGPPGPLETANNGTFRLSADRPGIIVPVNCTIPIEVANITNGTAVSLSSPCILLAPSQQYLVTAYINATSPEGQLMSFAFRLDDNPIPQSVFYSATTDVAAVSNSFIVNSGPGVNELCAINYGVSSIGVITIIVTVVKVA